jgi:FtsZ-binding cell division protein ZapB|tara:strand:- start:491 stop:778 length:288 start_codon:yes stop_codon:yes gene_type:complete
MSMINIISSLELKINKLLSSYNNLKIENNDLKNENSKISLELEDKYKEINALNDKIKIMSISKSVDVSNDDVKETRLKINEYIREVDKCIALLNN